jgi:hypothetical protein
MNYLDGVRGPLALTADKTIDSDLDTLPTLIAIHGIVTTADGGDLSVVDRLGLFNQLLHVTGSGAGGGVTTIAKEVDVDLGNLGSLGSIQKSIEVVLVTVDSTVRNLLTKYVSAE